MTGHGPMGGTGQTFVKCQQRFFSRMVGVVIKIMPSPTFGGIPKLSGVVIQFLLIGITYSFSSLDLYLVEVIGFDIFQNVFGP